MSREVLPLVIVAIIAVVLMKLILKSGAKRSEFSYRKLRVLFTPAERSFLGVLYQAVGNDAYVFGKVRVADVIAPQKGLSRSDWQKAFNKISGKHFDYLLCSKKDLSVLCAIELHDSSHKSRKRKERDKFLEVACASANLPLVQITAKAAYNIQEVQQAIAAYLPGKSTKQAVIGLIGSLAARNSKEIEKTCPKCGSPMVKKIARRGKNIGKAFWACSAFPTCRHIEKFPGTPITK